MAKTKITTKKSTPAKDKNYQAKLTKMLGWSVGLISFGPVLAVLNFLMPGGVISYNYFQADSYSGPTGAWTALTAIATVTVLIGLLLGATVFVRSMSEYEKFSPLNKRLYIIFTGIAAFILGYTILSLV